MKILFLDVDGVLNHAGQMPLNPHCVHNLAHVLRATGAKIVVSSAWRYLILSGNMTVAGFDQMLRTHSADIPANSVVGHTRRDRSAAGIYPPPVDADPGDTRAMQVREWMSMCVTPCDEFAIVDDMDLGFTDAGLGDCFVQTDTDLGMTLDDAGRLIDILTRKERQ